MCLSDLFWPVEFWLNLKEENVLIKKITTLGVKG